VSNNKVDQTPLAATIAKGQMQELAEHPSADISEALKQAANTRLEPRDGSTLYYATSRLSVDTRSRLLCTISLINAVSTSLVGVQEAQVAQTKLQWWNDEIGRLAHNEPRHPDTKRCAAWLSNNPSAQTQLIAISDAATAARFDAPTDDVGWLELVQHDYTARLALMHAALSNSKPPNLQAMALSAAWIDILRSLPSRIHHDQIALPPSLYERFKYSREQMQKHIRVQGGEASTNKSASDDAINSLLQAAISDAIAATDAALAGDAYQALRNENDTRTLSVWFRIRRSQLALWKAESPNLMRETMTLTPLKKWFIAFRYR